MTDRYGVGTILSDRKLWRRRERKATSINCKPNSLMSDCNVVKISSIWSIARATQPVTRTMKSHCYRQMVIQTRPYGQSREQHSLWLEQWSHAAIRNWWYKRDSGPFALLQRYRQPMSYLPNIPIQPLRSPRTTKTKLMLHLRDGNKDALGIIALNKLIQLASIVRYQVRLIRNRKIRALLCHLMTFLGVVSGVTPILQTLWFEPPMPCFPIVLPA